VRIAVIGGGAAGFFSAIHAKINHPKSEVILYEKSKKLLAKVKVSGGGRCNVTNGCVSINELCKAYPRGGKQLKKIFNTFSTKDTFNWFESKGIPLYTQQDNRVFPKSDSSQTIIDCLMGEMKKLNVKIETASAVKKIEVANNELVLTFSDSPASKQVFSHVIIASGGSPKLEGLSWLGDLGHQIISPVPSLFTFNMPNEKITSLMGVSQKEVLVKVQGTKLKSNGPLLITHWGMSGPAILKLSSIGARILNELNYQFIVQVNWANTINNDKVDQKLRELKNSHPNKKMSSIKPFDISERLWLYLLNKSQISDNKIWGELSKKSINKLINQLTNDTYKVNGKTTFKEEFVTCGGVSLDSVNLSTMESKAVKNLYFAGEVLDIDAITGGYNFQAAWSTGFIAGKLS